MYIKLGAINLQYYQDTSDWVILGEILDSGMSYEKPILVRTTDELDIWFGKDFKDYSYMQELINMGVVLYLYKPISNQTCGDDSYIDLDSYEENDNACLNNSEIIWASKVISFPEKYKFHYNTGNKIKVVGLKTSTTGDLVITEDISGRKFCTEDIVREDILPSLSYIYKSPIKFKVNNSDSFWIYNTGCINIKGSDHDWVSKVIDSPEKYKFKYYNEITEIGLKINSDGSLSASKNTLDKSFCTNKIINDEIISQLSEIYQGKNILDIDLLPQNINLTSSSSNNRDTLIVSKPLLGNNLDFTYLDYNSVEGEFGIYQNKELIKSLPDINSGYKAEINMEKVSEGYQSLMFKITGTSISSEDYFVFPDASHGLDTSKWRLYYNNIDNIPSDVKNMFSTDKHIQVSNLTNLIDKLRQIGYNVIEIERGKSYYLYSKTIIPVTNFYRSTNISVTPEIKITEAVLSRYITTGIEVVSKTIGRSSEFEDDLIQFIVEKSNDNYRITISRYSYSEIFEGSLKYIPGEQRLDNLISQQSKLIRCNFYGEELKTGTYYLRGATIEETTPEMYKYSLRQMLSTEYNEPVYSDYFLIPDKYKYTSNIAEDNPYQLFLDYSKEVGCQFLIENKDYRLLENSEKGDYVYNLTNDEENRLVYFFKSMTYNYEERPGYYAYLRGLLLNEYSISVKDILYETPTKDAFLVDDIEEQLIQYKSNYLVCDNQTYFYKDYQDGESFVTTGWTRFIVGKIYRELQKNSGKILGQQMLGKVRSNISDLLTSISRGFSIVKSIGITEFEPSENGRSLKVTIETIMNDLVKSDVSLDITVNYNNNGTIS